MTELKPIFEQWAKEKEYASDDFRYGYIAALDDKLADVSCKFAEWCFTQSQFYTQNFNGTVWVDQYKKQRTTAELFTYFIQHIYEKVPM